MIGIAICTPFIWMLSASFKTRAESEKMNLIPANPTIDNYPVVLGLKPDPATSRFLGMKFGRWYFNSLFVAIAVTYLQTLTSCMAAYAFSRIRWKWRDRIFFCYLATMMIPGVVTMIPNFQIMVAIGFLDSYHGLILPAAFSAFGTFLLRQFMISLPPALDEAAMIDGATHWDIFWEVIVPLTRPGIIALAIMTFLGNYQSFFWPLIMLNREELFTMPVGMLLLDSSYGRQTEYIMAATVLNVAPLIIIFCIFQKFMVKGLQLGGVKG